VEPVFHKIAHEMVEVVPTLSM